MSELFLFQDAGFGGANQSFSNDDFDLTNNSLDFFNSWNDQTSSLVTTGDVRLYENVDGGGAHWDLGPGTYGLNALANMGIPNDVISGFDLL